MEVGQIKNTLTEKEKDFLIDKIKNGETIPYDFKYKIFPDSHKEYELVYAGKMRKEDILSNEDGVFPVPLQVAKIFNGQRELFDDGWKNMLVFGDNLQFLKTIYQNQDELIKDKVKGKVKLIYIDPPFGTASDFDNKIGQIAYSDKAKGSDFVEFIRRRLILAKEILANDGSILVHLDWKKVHYIKQILDEVFGENNFRNEIIWKRKGGSANPQNRLGVVTDSILWYSNSSNITVNQQYTLDSDEVKKYIKERFNNIDENGRRFMKSPIVSPNPRENLTYVYKGYNPPENGWSISIDLMEKWDKENKLYFPKPGDGERIYRKIYVDEYVGQPIQNLWNDIFVINPMSLERVDYPTQKPEDLLRRILQLTTNEGDLVFDFFAGSGTLASVAEKMHRKWIICDIGKLSFYTSQKRLLQIEESKDLLNPNKKYNKKSKSFLTINTGFYDLKKLFELNKDKYVEFVINLFEVEKKSKRINGMQFDGERFGSPVLIWKFWEYTNSSIDEIFLEDLHSTLNGRISDKVYLIAPANAVDFISDYYEIGDIKYYFLKVPYQIIQELHKKQFKKFRQPKSRNQINELEDTVGFHFMRQPEVLSEYKDNSICITKFLSNFSDESTGKQMNNFESLAMVVIDRNYNGEEFVMTDYYFAEDIFDKKIPKNKKVDSTGIDIIKIPMKTKSSRISIVYIDIYGNEFIEELKLT